MPQVRLHARQGGYLAAQVLDPPSGSLPQELRDVLEAHATELLPIMDKPGTVLVAEWQDGDSEVKIYIVPNGADLSGELVLRLPFPDATDD
jgi:hypothetical protein